MDAHVLVMISNYCFGAYILPLPTCRLRVQLLTSSFIHSFRYLLINSFNHSVIHSCSHSLAHSFTVRSVIPYSFTHIFNRFIVRSLTQLGLVSKLRVQY